MNEKTITLKAGETIKIVVEPTEEFYSIAQVMETRGGTRKTVTNRLKKHGLITMSGNRPKVSKEQLNQYLTIYK